MHAMKKRFYNPLHHDLYVALFALVALGAILGLGYGLMEYEREYIDPCATEPIVDMDAIAFFDDYKNISSKELQEKFSEAHEHAVQLTGSIRFVDSHGEHLHLEAIAGGSESNFINCALREPIDMATYSIGSNVTVQCYCKGKKELDVSDDPFASMMGESSTEIVLYKCCVE